MNQESRVFSIILLLQVASRRWQGPFLETRTKGFVSLSDHSVLFVFIDGLGIGPGTKGVNPFAGFNPRVLRLRADALGPFPRGGICIPTEATLGLKGLPQSATGQTTLFTGVNAARKLGHHLQGFPSPSLKEVIAQESLFRKITELGYKVTFANAFTPRFFKHRPRWVSTTTVMTETAGIQLRDLNHRSLFMDFTNRFLRDRGFEVPIRSPKTAADVLVELTATQSLCLYEYFLTDLEGHRGSFDSAVELLRQLDQFLDSIIESLDLGRTSLVISSDHGNIEDMSHGQHTRNPVPTMIWGNIQQIFHPFSAGLRLEEITPLIVEFFETSHDTT